jgi:hypothetical protein
VDLFWAEIGRDIAAISKATNNLFIVNMSNLVLQVPVKGLGI